MRKRLLAISTLLFASSAFAAPNLIGQWAVHTIVVGNESDQVRKLVVTENKIAGACKAEDKDHQVTGTVDGNKATWQYESEYGGSPITLIYTATMGDTDKVTGTAEIQPFGVMGDFTATPVQRHHHPSEPGQARRSADCAALCYYKLDHSSCGTAVRSLLCGVFRNNGTNA